MQHDAWVVPMDDLTIRAIAEIAANTHAGAAEIAAHGAGVLLQCALSHENVPLEDFRKDILDTGRSLIRAQPAMAPLVNLVNTTLLTIEPCETMRAAAATVAKIARRFKRQLALHENAIAEAALPLIPEGACVLTHSRSQTVRAALFHSQHAGRHFRVICSESRPGCEGYTLASELAEAGIPVTLVTDALILARVSEAQVVLVGADHLAADGLINKAGTLGIALAARHCRVPIYGLCSSEKFLPPGYVPPPQEHRPPEQIWDKAPAGVTIENYYFDITPLTYLAGVVTERGVLTRECIEGWLASMHLQADLNNPVPEPV